ncbi:hypothetical protein FOT62_24690 [Serratia marcescens]|uniref:Uncharacterized protein n=1 Tax=Serratia marcescens TaxID=615 RepID=A0A5C7BUY8_SERMA|nr:MULTISPECIES: hypothetical protein [Serratia]TXE24605.1 hypothetical protein FOT62_24690 [Serratia marcescens]TXE53328.1 hypothetical protein FOT56_27125 [Serratia marcescens]
MFKFTAILTGIDAEEIRNIGRYVNNRQQPFFTDVLLRYHPYVMLGELNPHRFKAIQDTLTDLKKQGIRLHLAYNENDFPWGTGQERFCDISDKHILQIANYLISDILEYDLDGITVFPPRIITASHQPSSSKNSVQVLHNILSTVKSAPEAHGKYLGAFYPSPGDEGDTRQTEEDISTILAPLIDDIYIGDDIKLAPSLISRALPRLDIHRQSCHEASERLRGWVHTGYHGLSIDGMLLAAPYSESHRIKNIAMLTALLQVITSEQGYVRYL